MSLPDSNSECSDDSKDSDWSSISSFDMEVEDGEGEHVQKSHVSVVSEDELGYADEPLADEEWLANYEREEEENRELEERLQARLDGMVQVTSWCLCGKCSRDSLQNLSECYCCQELDGCKEAMCSELVLQDIQADSIACITEHPGFTPVCLQKWSLRMAADRLKTKTKERYRQTGSEESFLRSIAYREFCRLVYGFMENKRIPLPACPYTAIRKQFPISSDESFTGFELDENT